jgi:hypothetical protein
MASEGDDGNFPEAINSLSSLRKSQRPLLLKNKTAKCADGRTVLSLNR